MDAGRDEANGTASNVRVTIAVPTYRRNDHLRELLPPLIAQVHDVEEHLGFVSAEVLIVDNDPAGGARATVEGFAGGAAVRYVHEPEPGLTAARNRALDAAAASRLLAFIDDDGRPEDRWLQELVATWAGSDCAAVAGRVLERYEQPPTPWIVAGRFFRRRSLVTGTTVEAAPAGNLLLDLDVLRTQGLRFDPVLGLSGGEDTLLTMQLTSSGHRIVWCEEAKIVDLVPADRMNRQWVLRRAWSHGNTAAVIEQVLADSAKRRLAARVRCCVGGSARAVLGIGRYAFGRVTGRLGDQARGLRMAWRGAGMAAGSTGRVFQEYAR